VSIASGCGCVLIKLRAVIMSADEEYTGTCILSCGRDPHPEFPDGPRPRVCGPCRSRVAGQLAEIPRLCELLAAGTRPQVARRHERIEEQAEPLLEVDGSLAAVVRVERLYEVDVRAGAVRGQPSQPRVKGSREAPMPIKADAFDLLDIADERMVGDYSH